MLHHRERRRFSPEEYLLLEEGSDVRNEYCGGEIFSMAGGTPEHNLVQQNLAGVLGAGIQDRPCQVFVADVRLFVERHALFTYPDLMMVCGPWPLLAGRKDTFTDATLLAEVLSPSTMDYDRGEKFRFYRALPSFREYLLVAQDELRLEHHHRQDANQWLMTEYTSPEANIALQTLPVTFPLKALYRGVPL